MVAIPPSNTQIHDGDIYNTLVDKSIDRITILNTFYNYLNSNQFYAYLYKDGNCIDKYKMRVYFNRRLDGKITKENVKSFQHVTFKLKLSKKDMKELHQKTPYVNRVKIIMFDGIHYKGVFKTYKLNNPINTIIAGLNIIYCISIDKEGNIKC